MGDELLVWEGDSDVPAGKSPRARAKMFDTGPVPVTRRARRRTRCCTPDAIAGRRFGTHTRRVQFDEEWVNGAAHKEQSARDRDLDARRARWADQDRADLQGKGEAVQRAKRARRSERWRKSWPWLVFFGVAAVLIGGSRLLGF